MSVVIIVPDDGSGVPGVALNTTTGAILFSNSNLVTPYWISRSPQVGLSTDMLFAMNTSFSGQSYIFIYRWNGDATITQIGVFSSLGKTVDPYITAIGANFWTLTGFGGLNFNTPSFVKFSKTGAVLAGPIGPITFLNNGASGGLCVSLDETIGYYSNGLDNAPIKRWDLVNNIALTDLVANLGGADLGTIGFWPIQGSTDIVAILENFNWPTTNSRIIRRYTATGTIVYSNTFFDSGALGAGDPLAEVAMDPSFTSLWVRYPGPPDYDSFIITRFQQLRISDGTSLGFFDSLTDLTNGPASTCPLIALTTTSVLGTLIVNKVTQPDGSAVSFPIKAVGNTLSNFSLSDDGTKEFDNVPVGSGYSIIEDAVDGWVTEYSVSNGSPNTNISIAAGEIVTVTITNFKFTGGIYKIIRDSNKTNDTLWVDPVNSTTVDAKIPDPFADTGLVGD